MKVCAAHKKTSGLGKKQLVIVSPEECELCKMDNYFNSDNPARKSTHEVVEMSKENRRRFYESRKST